MADAGKGEDEQSEAEDEEDNQADGEDEDVLLDGVEADQPLGYKDVMLAFPF